MSALKRVVSLLLIVVLCVGFLPILSPAQPVQAVSAWTKVSGNPVFVDGALVSDPCVIYDAASVQYKMWYTKAPAAYTPLDTLLQTVLSLGPTTRGHLAANNFTALANDQVELKTMIAYLAARTSAELKTALQGASPSIGYATSPDGIHWTAQAPVLSADTSAWDAFGVSSPSVIKTGAASYEMWYNGQSINTDALSSLFIHLNTLTSTQIQTILTHLLVNKDLAAVMTDIKNIPVGSSNMASTLYTDILTLATTSVGSIGHASSTNGTGWSVMAQVLTTDSAQFDLFGLYYPTVVATSTGYTLWYSGLGIDSTAIVNFLGGGSVSISGLESILSTGVRMTICRAVSVNGTAWTKDAAPVIVNTSSPYTALIAPSVIRYSDTSYDIYYTLANLNIGSLFNFIGGSATIAAAVAGQTTSIVYSTSANGIAWSAATAVISPGSGANWDATEIGFPCAIQQGTLSNLWYTGLKTTPGTLFSGIINGPIATALTSSSTQSAVGYAYNGTPVLRSIAISGSSSVVALMKTNLTATGTYSDGSMANVTSSVIWSSSNTAIAAFNPADPAGRISGVALGGPISVYATLGTISGTASFSVTAPTQTSLTVLPTNPTIQVSATQQFTAVAGYSNGSFADVTAAATWSAILVSGTISTVSNSVPTKGLATAGATVGITTIQASLNGTATSTLNVIAASLDSITISPATATTTIGSTQAFTATGNYSDSTHPDITSQVTWNSSAPLVAYITSGASGGVATAASAGTTNITATLGGKTSNTAVMTVPPITLVSIAVTSSGTTLAVGLKSQYTATGNYSVGPTADLTNSVIWSSSVPAAASVNASGLATAATIGSTNIVATYGSVSGSKALGVTAAVVSSLIVTPANAQAPAGTTIQFRAYEQYTDGSLVDRTSVAVWTSNNAFATASATGLFTAVSVGTATVQAVYNLTATATLNVTAATLNSIAISGVAAIPAGTNLQLVLTGTKSDGSYPVLTTDAATIWASLSPANATVTAGGLVTGLKKGTTADITATNSGLSFKVTVTIADPNLTAVVVSPVSPKLTAGLTLAFTATGSYSDGSTALLSSGVTWSSGTTANATIVAGTGVATGVAAGTSLITATHTASGLFGTTTLTVTAATLSSIAISAPVAGLNIPAGRTTLTPFTAVGTYSDASTATITTQVTWSSSTANGTIGASTGLATGVSVGTSNITASLSGKTSNTLVLNITAAEVASFTISPANPSVAKGLTQQFTATGTYSNGTTGSITTLVTWNSATPATASIGAATGLTTGLTANSTSVISASITNSLGALASSNSATLTVTPAVVQSIAVTPAGFTLAAGLTQQYNATGTYSDGTTGAVGDLTASVIWSVTNSAAADFKPGNAAGLLTAVAPGSTNVKATFDTISGQTGLTVGAATLSALVITPVNPTVALGNSQQFRVVGVYSDGSRVDVTTLASWTSGTPASAAIGAGTGLATTAGKVVGTSIITAAYSSQTAATTLNVTAATLSSIALTPGLAFAPAGRTQQFTATGTYSDASTSDLTNFVTWSSTNTSIARINSAGLASTFVPGTANITAALGSVNSPAAVFTVTAKVLDSVVVSPSDNTQLVLVSGAPPTLQFVAAAVYSDGSTSVVTTLANWASTSAGVASVGLNTGLAASAAAGSTNITATFTDIVTLTSAVVTLTVLPDVLAPNIVLNSPVDGLTQPGKALTVSGRVTGYPAAGAVQVFVNSVATTLTLDGSGNFNQGVLLNNGYNSIYVRAVDGVGNIANSGTVTVSVNANKPVITVSNIADRMITNNPTLLVSGTASGVDTWNGTAVVANAVTLRFNGAATILSVAGGIFTSTVTLTEGDNIINVNGYATGNVNDADYLGSSGSKTVTLDTQAPVILITSPTNGKFVNSPEVTLDGTVNDPAVTTASLILNGAAPVAMAVSNGSFSKSVSLQPGANTLRVIAIDAVGNITSANNSVSLTYDNTKPEVSLEAVSLAPISGSTSRLITGSVDDANIRTASLIVNNVSQTIPVVPNGTNGVFSQTVTLINGANTVEVRVLDAGSNTGSSGVVRITVDTVAPVLTITLSDPLDTVNITVSSNEDLAADPVVKVQTTSVSMTQTGAREWTGVYTTAGAGDYTVRAQGGDIAGNSNAQTVYFDIKSVSISGTAATNVTTAGTSLDIKTNGAVSNASVSITQTFDNPSGNVGNPSGGGNPAGVFIEINAAPALKNNLNQIYIQVSYRVSDLPAGTDESTLRLYLWDTSTGTWQLVPESGVNTTLKFIYGTVTHLSQYGGFGNTQSSGGGGGIGAPPTTEVSLSGLNSSGLLMVNASTGAAMSNAQIKTTDNKVTFGITAGTTLKTSTGAALSGFTAAINTSPAAAPAGAVLISAYTFGPNGAVFSPGITLTLSYAGITLPAGVTESSLYIAWYDGTTWQKLTSTVDTTAKTVSALVTHFTSFAILGQTSATPVPTTVPPTTVPPTTVPPTSVPPTTKPPVTTTVPPTTVPPTTQPPTTVPTTVPPTTTPPPGTNWALIIPIIVVIAVLLIVIMVIVRRRK